MLHVINPANEKVLAELRPDDADSVRRKVEVARLHQPQWARTPLDDRRGIIARFDELRADRLEALAATLTSEMGKPIWQSRNEIRATGDRVAFFLDHVEEALSDRTVVPTKPGGTGERITREPLGVVANISAWNYPWFVGVNAFIPALLAGNAVIYKPSEHATLTGLAIAELLAEAGLPEEVFHVAVGGSQVGSLLIDSAIDGVFFTGSLPTGQAIISRVARKLIKVQLELGGKDPMYVCDDVDIEHVAESAVEGAFYNAGQSCCAVERIYVHHAIAEPFLEAMQAKVAALKVGDPTQEDTWVGPLAREAQLGFLDGQVKDAVAKGAELLVGGQRLDGTGYYFAPTLLANADHTMTVMVDESFGPVIGVAAVENDAEAVESMSDTSYGLTASVYTKDEQRALAILRQLDVGSAYWNCCDRVSPRLPWSGRRFSGVGLTLSIEGITTFTEPKAYHLRP